MRAAGIRVKVDLIIGLPGDTAESIRRGIRYFVDTGFCRNTQVFQLSVLPGTAFRQEAQQLGLRFSPRPPYYVLETPTLKLPEMVDLMREAQQEFGIEFDALRGSGIGFSRSRAAVSGVARGFGSSWTWVAARTLPFDRRAIAAGGRASQAFTLWLRRGFS